MTHETSNSFPLNLKPFEKYKTFFGGKEELSAIPKNSEKLSPEKLNGRWFQRWKVALIIARSPFDCILYVFYKGMSWLFYFFSFPIQEKLWNLSSQHCFNQFQTALTQLVWGRKFLVPSFNVMELQASDIYKVKNSHRVEQGVSYGGVNWFNYLFLKSIEGKNLPSNEIKRLAVVIAHYFKDGQPLHAGLLQILKSASYFLNLTEQKLPLNSSVSKREKTQVAHLDRSLFSDGVYHITLSDHIISYIKYEALELIWDPGSGLYNIETEEDILSIFSMYDEDFEFSELEIVLQKLIPQNTSKQSTIDSTQN